MTPKERAAMQQAFGYEYETINATSVLDAVSLVIAVVLTIGIYATIIYWSMK